MALTGTNIRTAAARATSATLTEAVARLDAAIPTLTGEALADATARRTAFADALADREALAASLTPAHTYAREEDDERGVRMVCSCGKKSHWGTYGSVSRAAERHAAETARRGH